MKKIIISIFSETLFYALIATLAFASYVGSHSLLNIAAMAYWFVILLGVLGGCLYGFMAFALKYSSNADDRQKTIEALTRFSKKKNTFFRYLSWFHLALIVCLLAYSGWVFTAVCYALASFFTRMCIVLIREELEKLNKPESTPKIVGIDGCHNAKI